MGRMMPSSEGPMLPTCLVGSYPQPEWLIDRARLSKQVPRVRARDLWLVAPDKLEAAQDDATDLAIHDQERAGIDICSDGEPRGRSDAGPRLRYATSGCCAPRRTARSKRRCPAPSP